MKLTYKDIKNSVCRLCFLEESEYEDYEKYIEESVNFALIEVARAFPLTDRYTIVQNFEENAKGYASYDMQSLIENEKGKSTSFMGFANNNPVVYLEENGDISFCDYNILEDRLLLLKKSMNGEFEVFYKKYPEMITEGTDDGHEIEFRPEVANLIPLLCAWRIFKDDDETKAAQYYNEYLQMKSEITVPSEVKRRSFKIDFIDREGAFA